MLETMRGGLPAGAGGGGGRRSVGAAGCFSNIERSDSGDGMESLSVEHSCGSAPFTSPSSILAAALFAEAASGSRGF